MPTGRNFCGAQQEDQLGALGLVVNIIVLWNTLYMDAAVEQLQAGGFPVRPEDVARLSPLVFEHINLLGRYAFPVPGAVSTWRIAAALVAAPIRAPLKRTKTVQRLPARRTDCLF